ncbi:cyclic nucleotide-binding domain-containing protein [Flavobacterium sp. LC2016-01]|uniref:Crp/Fnr family transcriptional regulator n=1 Tax=Flavobacterium sp. LC2016-01 TaxID=2675876 RepID=UPI0012BA5757|nr:cyclic nucleotide-binding domain-containing protein [Flavobacterium sp. LC2016-01]MTH16606.1 cyclic nucleotide-binding domain-containing protein [Flavobacterium sp. LC2016-01]
MDDLQVARQFLSYCCNLSEEAFLLSADMWNINTYKKGDKYSKSGRICRTSSFIVEGYFRTYKQGPDGEQRNVFIHSPGQTLVSFVSFVQQVPCDHDIEAITDAKIISISYDDLQELYKSSIEWGKVGRLFAEYAYKLVEDRFLGYYDLSPEERYLKLINEAPEIFNVVALKDISSFLGIEFQSLCRIRKRVLKRKS